MLSACDAEDAGDVFAHLKQQHVRVTSTHQPVIVLWTPAPSQGRMWPAAPTCMPMLRTLLLRRHMQTACWPHLPGWWLWP